jgi:hypothetical protein
MTMRRTSPIHPTHTRRPAAGQSNAQPEATDWTVVLAITGLRQHRSPEFEGHSDGPRRPLRPKQARRDLPIALAPRFPLETHHGIRTAASRASATTLGTQVPANSGESHTGRRYKFRATQPSVPMAMLLAASVPRCGGLGSARQVRASGEAPALGGARSRRRSPENRVGGGARMARGRGCETRRQTPGAGAPDHQAQARAGPCRPVPGRSEAV